MVSTDLGCMESTQLLLQHGADPNITDAYGSTALLKSIDAYLHDEDDDWYRSQYLVIIRLLAREYGADTDVVDGEGVSVRTLVNETTDPALLEILLPLL